MYKMFITEDVMGKSKFKQTKHKVFTSKHPACYILLVSGNIIMKGFSGITVTHGWLLIRN